MLIAQVDNGPGGGYPNTDYQEDLKTLRDAGVSNGSGA